MNDAIIHTIEGMSVMNDTELSAYALMDRVDAKYLISAHNLPQVLSDIEGNYHVVSYAGEKISRCANKYYDTISLKFYHDHHNGKRRRYKVRVRTYVDAQLSYLEVKKRQDERRTIKSRIKYPSSASLQEGVHADFIKYVIEQKGELYHVISNDFRRLTLVHRDRLERVTIDMGISFDKDGKRIGFPSAAVIEVKSERKIINQGMAEVLKKSGHRPTSMSKYCVGISNLYPAIKKNRFKSINKRLSSHM